MTRHGIHTPVSLSTREKGHAKNVIVLNIKSTNLNQMDKLQLFERQNPGWTLKVKACGHYESEQLPLGATYMPTYGTTAIAPTPQNCPKCRLEIELINIQWRRLKDEMENG
jgi:hypothetical protein